MNNNYYGKAFRAALTKRSPFTGHCNANALKLMSIEKKKKKKSTVIMQDRDQTIHTQVHRSNINCIPVIVLI